MKVISYTLFFVLISISVHAQNIQDKYGAIVRSDTTKKIMYLCFTGHEYTDGFTHVIDVLQRQNIQASFFFTGDFVRNHKNLVKKIARKGHFIGAHSDKHLLYCAWENRDSLVVSEEQIRKDILQNLVELQSLDIYPKTFMPPYEWYNQYIVDIAQDLNQTTINFTSGTRTNADYTTPDMANYQSSQAILNSLHHFQEHHNMNGVHLLIHPGTNPKRKDKFYCHLEDLILRWKKDGYQFSSFR